MSLGDFDRTQNKNPDLSGCFDAVKHQGRTGSQAYPAQGTLSSQESSSTGSGFPKQATPKVRIAVWLCHPLTIITASPELTVGFETSDVQFTIHRELTRATMTEAITMGWNEGHCSSRRRCHRLST